MIEIKHSDSQLQIVGSFSREELESESYSKVQVNGSDRYTVVCDDVKNIDSFFVAWLIGLQRTLHIQGMRFELKAPPQALSNLISLYRLEETLPQS